MSRPSNWATTLVLMFAAAVHSFQPVLQDVPKGTGTRSAAKTVMKLFPSDNNREQTEIFDHVTSRRGAISDFAKLASISVILGQTVPAHAKRARGAAVDLNKTPETREEREARIKRERAEYEERRKLAEEKEKELVAGKERTEVEMGSNLRGDYYYPTARKRYLPRIRKAYEALEEVLANLNSGAQDWDKVQVFVKGPGDVASALKLYVSALGGGGLSISSKFMERMRNAAAEYETAYAQLKEGQSRKDVSVALASFDGLKNALVEYRTAGKPAGLTNDDWGVGEIPDCKNEPGGGVGKMSKCAVGSSFGNANPNLYKRNVQAVEAKAAPLLQPAK